MKVHWTDRAKHRLRLIHDYIAQYAPHIAPQVIERLIQRSQDIGAAPILDARFLNTGAKIFVKSSNVRIASSTAYVQIVSMSST
jgi:plasmid stabilization system protein ParE